MEYADKRSRDIQLTEDYRKKEREHKQKYRQKKRSMKSPKKSVFSIQQKQKVKAIKWGLRQKTSW